ncbi:MAG: hypothetical protein R2713_12290 [Ilumatobacteraceae bacterium]
MLVEWKYTETYSPHEPEPAKNAERRRRYEHLLMAPDSPVDGVHCRSTTSSTSRCTS